MQNVQRKSIRNTLLVIFAVLIVARLSCVALSSVPFFSISFVFMYIAIFVLLFIAKIHHFTMRELGMTIVLLIHVTVVVGITVVSTGDLFNTAAFNSYILFFLYLLYLVMKRLPEKDVKRVFFVAVIGFAFTLVYSIFQLIKDPLLSRKSATGVIEEETVDVLGGVGGFDTVYGTLLLICVCLFVWQQTKVRKEKIVTTVMLLVAGSFLIMASYGTALVLVVVLFGLWLFQRNRVWGILVLVAGAICYMYRVEIGTWLVEYSEGITYSYMLREKLQQIGTMMSEGSAAGTLAGDDGRLARMMWSWDTFLKHPFAGGYGYEDAHIGYHSEIFDIFGQFGIIGGGTLFLFLGIFFKDVYAGMKTDDGKKCCLLCLTIYLAIMVLNPALYTQQILPLFVILPFYEMLFSTEEAEYV